MTQLQQFTQDAEAVAVAVGAALGAVSVFATFLSHVPRMPARAAEFFARLGVATQKFSVNKRPDVATSTNPIAPVESK
jgi:hypothetical protein